MNKLFTSIAVASLSLTMAVGVGVAVGQSAKRAQRVNAVDYTEVTSLSITKNTSKTAYATYYTVGNWKIPGNQGLGNYVKMGGKFSSETRYVCSTTTIDEDIAKVKVSLGEKDSAITVNSMTVTAHESAADALSGSNPTYTFTYTYAASSDVEEVKSDSTNLSGKYWRLAFSMSSSASSSNKGLILNGMTFYKVASSTPSVSLDSSDVYLCAGTSVGQSVKATVTGVASPEYEWSTDDSSVTLSGTSTDTVSITPNSLVADTATVTLNIKGTSLTASVTVHVLTAYSVSGAVSAIESAGTTIENVFVEGIVSQIDSYNAQYHNITYWISDDGSTTDQFEVYRGKNVGNTDFNAITDIELGGQAIIFGSIKKYTPQSGDPIYEFNQDNYLISYVAPTITLVSISGIEGSLQTETGTAAWDLDGQLTPKGVLSNSANVVDISAYVTLSTTDVPGTTIETRQISVTVTPNAGSVPAESFSVSATVTAQVDQIVISRDTASIATSYGTVDWTSNGISGKVHGTQKNTYIQWQGGTSFAYNADVIPGYITSIEIEKAEGSYRELTAYVGTELISSQPENGGTPNNTNWTWTFQPSNHYTYFYIKNTSGNAAYFSTITVKYEKIPLVDPTGISLNKESTSMDTYGSEMLTATVEPFNANDKTVTWESSNTSVATVTNGLIVATGAGSAVISAKTSNFVSEEATPELIAKATVTVSQAEYLKGMHTFTSTTAVTNSLDYPAGCTATGSSTGQFVNEKAAVQVGASKNVILTLSGYEGQTIIGFDLMMASNDAAGAGSLTLVAGTSNTLYEIEATSFSNEEWNGAFSSTITKVSKDLDTAYLVQSGENLVLTISGTINSLYLQSVSIRYLDGSLKTWCEGFLTALKGGENPICKGVGITDTSDLKDAWDNQGLSFLYDVVEASQTAAAGIEANENGNTIEQAMYLYDWCVAHYDSTICDRFITGRSANNAVIANQSIFNSIDSQATTAIIVVVALTSVTAIGAIFFIKRRKYN